jgi:prepilin-type N-terminal cleavage/methylation domain-containing protein
MRQRGFSMIEVLVAVTIGGLIVLAGVPAMTNLVQRSRLDTATRELLSDVREARSRAITTGWEFSVIGFHATTGGSWRNQYRLIGRRSGAVAWPDTDDAPFSSATQFAGAWVDLTSRHSGVSLQPSATSFTLTFGPRGTPTSTSGFAPLVVANDNATRSLTVSTSGAVRIN